MAKQQMDDCLQPNLLYQPLELSQHGCSQRTAKKTHSHISTRKGSADSLDLRVKFKTEMCKYYNMSMECPFSELCSFAHGEDELRNRDFLPNRYKTKKCSKFSQEGFCPYGQRCQFIHSQGNHAINYERLVQTIRNESQVFYEVFVQNQGKKPRRLSFFQKMEAVEESDEKAEEEPALHALAGQILVNRTRHNSM